MPRISPGLAVMGASAALMPCGVQVPLGPAVRARTGKGLTERNVLITILSGPRHRSSPRKWKISAPSISSILNPRLAGHLVTQSV